MNVVMKGDEFVKGVITLVCRCNCPFTNGQADNVDLSGQPCPLSSGSDKWKRLSLEVNIVCWYEKRSCYTSGHD